VIYCYFAFQSINAYIYFTNEHNPLRLKEQVLDKFVINGGKFLSGTVTIGGAKNASLALMPATILASGTSHLSNTPDLRDITTMSRLLETMGIQVSSIKQIMTIDTTTINNYEAPYEHVKKMRASIYVLGPLVARFGQAKVSLPGGCAWGPRPVNLHVEGIRRLGAEIGLEAGYIIAKAKRLHGARILFDVSSVGATGNVMMAAVLAKGTTLIENAAQEPEIVQLAEFLLKMGAKIHGVGTGHLEIEGVDELHPADIATIPDRIEAGTFLIAGAIAGKRGSVVRLEKCNPHHIGALIIKLEDAGAKVNTGVDWIELSPPERIAPINVTTAIYPGFPTDMQAQWIALMLLAGGTSIIKDTVYFDRFMHVPELVRLGANITVKENIATVVGVKKLAGAKVMSTDLRASASLILAGLVAEGTTEVLRVYHIDRGYESMEKKLQALGADIRREQGEEF
jgi:UDP-N-acetylglucosamine 1-carboxyvinyltransferase